MWKIWLAAGLAVIVAIITAGMGILHQLRFEIILQRTIISILIAGSLGYALSVLIERVGLPYLLGDKSAGQEEKVSFAEGASSDEAGDKDTMSEMEESPDFAPFSADNLDRVLPPNV